MSSAAGAFAAGCSRPLGERLIAHPRGPVVRRLRSQGQRTLGAAHLDAERAPTLATFVFIMPSSVESVKSTTSLAGGKRFGIPLAIPLHFEWTQIQAR
jgi:hypothetical protein